jgi:drug/metabolite transporter (DMT)-like permease
MGQNNRLLNWILFIALSFIWGTSFILMKEGMQKLTPFHVASLRMLSAGLILLPVALKRFKTVPRQKLSRIFLSGLLGSFFPAFLFCIAETKIDSALAGILNALTPICVIVIGTLAYRQPGTRNQVAGVIIGFLGVVLLLISSANISLGYVSYSLLVLLATLSYGLNVNMVNKFLLRIQSLSIASIALSALVIPSFLVLWFTGFFYVDFHSSSVLWSIGCSMFLGLTGTAIATILFYMLLKTAGPIFSSMVTYGIPLVAMFWGWLAGEAVTMLQGACLLVILAGVYISRR